MEDILDFMDHKKPLPRDNAKSKQFKKYKPEKITTENIIRNEEDKIAKAIYDLPVKEYNKQIEKLCIENSIPDLKYY
jgi:hypothetical protein